MNWYNNYMSTLAERIKKENPWIGKIPLGSHGSGAIQKKYWKVTSDFVRIRDAYSYGGRCVSCPRTMQWQDLQAGHAKAWAVCHGYSKWDMDNIFGQCPYCNKSGDALTGRAFTDEIRRRHGKKRLDYIESLSRVPLEKIEDHILVGLMKVRLQEMADLPEQPEYYYQVKYLIS